MMVSDPTPRPELVLKTAFRSDCPPASEWVARTGDNSAKGHYHTDNLVRARAELHSKGVCPWVSLDGRGAIKTLRVHDALIHRLPPESLVCQEFATVFRTQYRRSLVYRGQSIAAFANDAFSELCRPPVARRKINEAQQKAIWRKQGSVCNLCGSMSPQINVDHICPRFAHGSDEDENMQAICQNCHAQKTMLEALSIVEDDHPVLSRFSLETHKALVESHKPQQLVADLITTELGAISVDVRRCRYNA